MHNPPLILIADDEADTILLLTRICTRAGFAVASAANGVEALEVTRSKLPDLLLLDIQMPRMDGFQVLEELRKDDVTRQIPIIVITAAATKPEDAARGINIGADDYLIKPFNYNELLARMRAKIRAKELEERLQRRTEELESLVKLGVEISRPLGLGPLAEQLLLFLNAELGATRSLIHLRPTSDTQGLFLSLYEDSQFESNDPASFTEGDYSQDSPRLLAADEAQSIFANEAVQQGITVPLMYHDEILGMIAIAHEAPEFFDEAQVRLMRSISKQTALAVRNAHLYEALRTYAEDLEERVEERTAALKAAQEQLVRSEKLASLGRLSGEIAHEINNPLQPIMTSLEDAIEDAENGSPADLDDLKMAIQEVKRLQRTVTRLLDFARPDSAGMTKTHIQEVIEEVLALTRKKIAHTNIQLETELKPVPVIQANPDQLKQVFLNLAINAIDAMSQTPSGKLVVKLWEEGQFVQVLIKDNGTGISEEQVSRIFEPYFSTKEDGSGLGLSISHSIVEGHGGKFHVQSKLGSGTEFTISLPLR